MVNLVKKGLLLTFSLVLLLSLTSAVTLDLELYPHYFIDDNDFNAVIVVGENAATADSIGASNLVAKVQEHLNELEDERRAELDELRDRLERENELRTFGLGGGGDLLEFGKTLGDVEQSLSEYDNDRLLPSGSIRTSQGTADYSQFLKFREDGFNAGLLVFDENDEDNNVADFLFFEEDEVMFEYVIDFGSGLDSEIDGSELEDLEGESFNMLGKTVTITDARLRTNGRVDLTILMGDKTDLVEEGSSHTYTIGDKEYKVDVVIISDNANRGEGAVKFRVNNDHTTDMLSSGETEVLGDGTLIGVRSIIPNEAGEIGRRDLSEAEDFDYDDLDDLSTEELERRLSEQPNVIRGGGDLVEFYLGAEIIEFSDDADDAEFSSDVEIGNDNQQHAEVKIVGAREGDDKYSIQSITYRATAQSSDRGDVYLGEGKSLRENLRDSNVMLTSGWDLKYNGLNEVEISEIDFNARGDDSYELLFTNTRGDEYTAPLVDSSSGLRMGDEEDQLFFIECDNSSHFCIPQDAYLVVTDKNSDKGVTSVVQYRDIDVGDNQLTFSDLGGGDDITVTYTGTLGVDAHGDLRAGGDSYDVYIGNESENYAISVDLNQDGDVDNGEANVVAQGGAVIDLGSSNDPGADFTISIITAQRKFDGNGPADSGSDEVINITIKDEGSDIGLDIPTQPFLTMRSRSGNNLGMTNYGALYNFDDSGTEELTIQYPHEQRGGSVELITGDNSSTADLPEFSGYGGVTVGTTVTDTEIRNIAAQNMIVIGGPCTNKVAAKLLDNLQPCDTGFKKGKSMIRLFENRDNFALLVAGYEPKDTQVALEVLYNFEEYTRFDGSWVEVSGTKENPKLKMMDESEWETLVHDHEEALEREENATLEANRVSLFGATDTNDTQADQNLTANATDDQDAPGTTELPTDDEPKSNKSKAIIIVALFIIILVIALNAGKGKRRRKHPGHHPHHGHHKHPSQSTLHEHTKKHEGHAHHPHEHKKESTGYFQKKRAEHSSQRSHESDDDVPRPAHHSHSDDHKHKDVAVEREESNKEKDKKGKTSKEKEAARKKEATRSPEERKKHRAKVKKELEDALKDLEL